MRTEITKHRRNRVRGRVKYIRDADGKHKAKGLEVQAEWWGVANEVEFHQRLAEMSARPQGRGAPIQHHAIEVSAHPVDAKGARRPFRNLEEMKTVGHALMMGLRVKVGLLGYHDLQDLHGLGLNFGPTGLSLRSYVPNRSNLRRVVVAIADRVEREINEERMKDGHGKLIPMSEIRDEARKKAGRRKQTEIVAEQLDLTKELTVSELLKAFRRVKLRATVQGPKLLVSSVGQKKPSSYELDLFMRGVWRELLIRRELEKTKQRKAVEKQRKKAEMVPYELLVRALTAFHQGWAPPVGIEEWLRKDSTGMVEQPALLAALLNDTSPAKEDYMSLKALLEIETMEEMGSKDKLEK